MATRLVVGQSLSCFCRSFLSWSDEHAPLHLFGMQMDGFMERSWVKGSEVEACKAKYHSMVHEHRQLGRTLTKSRPELGNVPSFYPSQVGFRACRKLYKLFISCNIVGRGFFVYLQISNVLCFM